MADLVNNTFHCTYVTIKHVFFLLETTAASFMEQLSLVTSLWKYENSWTID
jgi:hypothetical protein